DLFSVEGLNYYKRDGLEQNEINENLLADANSRAELSSKTDKVIYPINRFVGEPTSQIDAAIWLINQGAPARGLENAIVLFWLGNNDSGLAALGAGGNSPQYQPIPFDVIKAELSPILRLLFTAAEALGELSFEPYTQEAIERNLTDTVDFADQFDHLMDRLVSETASSGVQTDVFLMTLPYYSAVGYLFDSEDLEFYFQKLDPSYTVPPTFKRVAEPGEPITQPFKGDRISLVTFGLLYAAMSTGATTQEVNRALEIDGIQQDGMVLSEAEQQFIMSRIDEFNDIIKTSAMSLGPDFHLVDIGQFMNDALTGVIDITIGGKTLSRKWVRGSGFSLDGVHPGYTAQALLANYLLSRINPALGLNAPLHNLTNIIQNDPYIDWDEDGWAPGPNYEAISTTELLFLFKDPDDSTADVQAEMPPDVWQIISNILLDSFRGQQSILQLAEELGVTVME
ncbi:MAG: hypothetical protein IIC24_09745, partial [Chloroflexi bacterium]|nr:hypothetical protein [Chloroflexota bacterium]